MKQANAIPKRMYDISGNEGKKWCFGHPGDQCLHASLLFQVLRWLHDSYAGCQYYSPNPEAKFVDNLLSRTTEHGYSKGFFDVDVGVSTGDKGGKQCVGIGRVCPHDRGCDCRAIRIRVPYIIRSLMGLRPDHLTAHLKLQYNKCAIATSIANNSTIC
jgi:hypothetical protein